MDESFAESPATPEVADNSPEVIDAPSPAETSADTSTPEPEFTNFRLEDVPDEHRPYVEQAYNQLRADYTRKRQDESARVKEAEGAVAFINNLQSEDHRQAALQQLAEQVGQDAVLEALGISLVDDETPDEPVDPGERALQEIEALKAESAQAKANAAEAQRIASIDQHVSTQLEELGVKDTDEQAVIVNLALAGLPPGEDGMPRIKEAFEKVNGLWEKRQKSWIESKGAQKVSGGQAGVQEYDWKNPEERIARMAAVMAANDE